MSKYDFSTKLFIFLIFASFICSMYPWFVWNNYISIIIIIVTSFTAFINFFKTNLKNKKIPIFFVIILFASCMWDSILLVPFMKIIMFMNVFFLFVLILQDDSFKKDVLDVITKWFSIILLISLTAYLLHCFSLFPISPSKIQFGERYASDNYYLFIVPQQIFVNYFVRFRSIFAEPGHMAMGTTLLLMANRFNLKNRYVMILFIANIFSFSLAAYITMFIGYLLYNLSLKKIKYIVVFLVGCGLVAFTMYQTGNGDILDGYIWNRLQYSESTETIEGNNRTTKKFENVYEMTISRIDLLLLGNDEYDVNDNYGGNAGYKKYIVEKGLVGVFFVLLFYLYAPFALRTRESFIFSFILLLLLCQDAYPFWGCVSITYIVSFPIIRTVHN